MSFPTAAQLAALTTEINTDPKGRGYIAQKNAGSDSGIVALINAPGSGTGPVYRNDVSAAEIVAAMVESEVSLMTQTQFTRVLILLTPPTIDATVQNVRDQFTGVFTGRSTTLIGIATLIQKQNPSRAEELFGYGTVVQPIDVAHALGRG